MSIDYSYWPYYFSFDKISVPNFCTTRYGGISLWPYSSLNLGFNTSDNPKNIKENMAILLKRLHMPVGKCVYLNQIHTDKIYHVDASYCGKSLEKPDIEGDGLFTEEKGICLFVMLADCVGLILYEPEKQVIGVCHSGWKGCVLNICGKLVENMVKNCGCDSEKLIAGISPAICGDCYNVGYEIAQNFTPEYRNYLFNIKNSWRIDLIGIVKHQLLEKGIKKENIYVSDICTYENTHIFYSHRAEKDTGRFVLGLWL